MSQNAPGLGELNERVRSLEEIAESEHRFRKLVEALPDAIVVHTDGRIVFVNPFAIRLHKATTPEQLLGHEIDEFIKPELRATIKNRIEECYLTGEASVPMEVPVIACDGSSVDTEAVAIPISWHGAPPIEVVLRDTRERKRAEQAAHNWQKRLELAQKAGLRIGLWDWDVVANTVMWSDETYRQYCRRTTTCFRAWGRSRPLRSASRLRKQEKLSRLVQLSISTTESASQSATAWCSLISTAAAIRKPAPCEPGHGRPFD